MEEQFLKPEEVCEVLLKIQAAALDIVLVGGQAVNFWALRHATDHEDWTKHHPFTSTDIDVLGGRQDVIAMASLLEGKAIVNEDMDGGSPNTGIVLVPHSGGNLQINVLGSLFGLDSEEVARESLVFLVLLVALVLGVTGVLTWRFLSQRGKDRKGSRSTSGSSRKIHRQIQPTRKSDK